MADNLTVVREDAVAVLTITREQTRNDISGTDFVSEFEEACAALASDRDVAAVIVTGAGSAFSSGGNITEMRDRTGMFSGDVHDVRDSYRNVIQRIPKVFYELEIPTIAAVNGPAIGAGCDLTLMCDIRIASEKAVFAESFLKAGLIPGDGGAWLLQRAVGMSRTAEMMFTADAVNAETALEWGLVSRVVPHDTLMEEAMVLAQRIARNPPRLLRMAKRLLRDGATSRLPDHLELSAAFQAFCHNMPEHDAQLESLMAPRVKKTK